MDAFAYFLGTGSTEFILRLVSLHIRIINGSLFVGICLLLAKKIEFEPCYHLKIFVQTKIQKSNFKVIMGKKGVKHFICHTKYVIKNWKLDDDKDRTRKSYIYERINVAKKKKNDHNKDSRY